MSNKELSDALKNRLASFKNSMGHVVTDGVMPILEPIGRAYDRFAGAPTRAALAELQAGRGLEAATPAFMAQFGNESDSSAPTMKDMAENAGVPNTSLSEMLPDVYSDTGAEWNKLKRGGMLDPTASGTYGAIASMGTDPGMLAGAGMGRFAKGAALDTALMNESDLASEAIKQRAAAKMPVIQEAKNTVAPFELPKGLPADAEGLEALVKKGAPKTGASIEPVKQSGMGDAIMFPSNRVSQNYLPKDADVIDMKEALKRRDLSKSGALDVVDEAPKEEIMPMPYDFETSPTPKPKDISNENSLASVTELPKDKMRNPIKDPIPPGVDPEDFQAYTESPMAGDANINSGGGFLEAKNSAIKAAEDKLKYKTPNKKSEADILSRMKALDEEIATYDANSPDLDPLLQEKLDLDKEHSNLSLRNPPKKEAAALKQDLSGADPIEASKNKVVSGKFVNDKEFKQLSKQNKENVWAGKEKSGKYVSSKMPKEKPSLGEAVNSNGLTEQQQNILARFSPDESITAKKISDIMRTPHDQPYIGNKDVHNSVYATPSNAHIKMPDTGMPAYPANTSLDQLPKVMGKRILGKDVANANMDPLPWMDRRYGVSKNLIDESVKKNIPMQINTRSDLIATQDYMDKLDPKLHDIHLYFGPTNDNMHRLVNPGMASTKRMQQAAQALEAAGIKPTIHLDTFPDIKNAAFTNDIKAGFLRMQKEHPGVRIVENPIKMGKEQLKAFERETGINPHIVGDEGATGNE